MTDVVSYSSVKTWVEVLQHRARMNSNQTAYTFLPDGDVPSESVSYAELDLQARSIAGVLQRSFDKDERVLLLFPPGLDFIRAFFGCLYAGMIAVPAPLNLRRPQRSEAIVNDASARVALTASRGIVEAVSRASRRLGALTWHSTETIASGHEGRWHAPKINRDALALLQYTSGSTAAPKGVMVTHSNLLHNSEIIRQAFELDHTSLSVSWLPFFHDMGLIDGILQPVFSGFPAILMPPLAFLQRPVRWLQAISKYRATHSGGPDFAYALCAEKIAPEQRVDLDLSSWVSAYNGAEPIRAETLTAFEDAFAPCGFRSLAAYPCYGLAESTLMVSGGRIGEPPRIMRCSTAALEHHQVVVTTSHGQSRAIVGCGFPHFGSRVAIVEPRTREPCRPGQVGEIWVQSPSVANGYWGRPDETVSTFKAQLGLEQDGTFLRTGDLGFLQGDELFVTGRLKDLIVIRGSNYYPQDIEHAAEAPSPTAQTSGTAAFSMEIDGHEQIVIVQEVPRAALNSLGLETISQGICRSVADHLELSVHTIVFIRPGTLPKTSSGKIQRQALRAKFLNGSLAEFGRTVVPNTAGAPSDPESLQEFPPSTDALKVEFEVRAGIAKLLSLTQAQAELHIPLVMLGLDSLRATELLHSLSNRFGVELSIVLLHQNATGAQLVDAIVQHLGNSSDPAHTRENPTVRLGQLSRGQQALLYQHRLEPNNPAYHVHFAGRVNGDLDPEFLRKALGMLVLGHPSLRSTFIENDGATIQAISKTSHLDYRVTHAETWSADELDGALHETFNAPFDLKTPPFRVRVFKRSDEEYILLFVAHHIIFDGWSLGILLAELTSIYEALRSGAPIPNLGPIGTVQEHAEWQLHFLGSAEGDRHREAWKSALAGASSHLPLPRRRFGLARLVKVRASRLDFIGERSATRLRTLARTEGVTTFTLLLTIFQVLLHRHTGHDDLCIGSIVDGRRQSRFARTIGYLANQIVLRSRLIGNPSFREFLRSSRRATTTAFEIQDFPFPDLVRSLNPERDGIRAPLFEAMFLFQRVRGSEAFNGVAFGLPGSSIDWAGLRLHALPLAIPAVEFDLTLTIVEGESTVGASWAWNSEVFDAPTIECLAEEFLRLIECVPENMDECVRTLSSRREQSMRADMIGSDSADRSITPGATVLDLIASAAQRNQGAIAVEQGDRRLTYADLDCRSGRFASRLRELGVQRGDYVGVCLTRSIELVVALISVLKIGAAFVPLDQQHPGARLRSLAQRARAVLVIAENSTAGPFHEHVPVLLCESSDEGLPAPSQVVNPVDANDLAYVMFTSGSTGEPKGVMVTHGGFANYISWCCKAYEVATGRGAPVASSIAFDATLTSLFCPLAVGRTVVMIPEANEIAALGEALVKSGEAFSFVKITPAHLTLLGSHMRRGETIGTRAFVVGGEALPAHLAMEWRKRAPQVRIFNEYGPTETVVGCCVHEITEEDLAQDGEVPIGRPIVGTRLSIIDSKGAPVPVGVVGELLISGVGLARGYLEDPVLTAERFPVLALSDRIKVRVYRTGDLASLREDGTFLFWGRTDNQIKLRGHRIDPTEIEAGLLRHPAVQAAVVVPWGEAHTRRLVAYVVLDRPVNPAALRSHLAEFLPTALLPSNFVRLDSLPLTPNGKVDHRALPVPREQQARGLPPRSVTATQRTVAQVWCEVLYRDSVGIDENFFEAGGDSLLTLELQRKLAHRLGRDVPLLVILRASTIRGFALYLDGNAAPESDLEYLVNRTARRRDSRDRARQRRLATIDESTSARGLLVALKARGVELRRHDGQLTYTAPRGALPPELLAQMRDKQDALLKLLPSADESGHSAMSNITRSSRDLPSPLTRLQETFWQLEQLIPGNPFNNMFAAYELSGNLQIDALRDALDALVRRHEVFRSVFVDHQGIPSQIVQPPQPFCLTTDDLRGEEFNELHIACARRVVQDANMRFDLGRGPTLRARLIRTDETRAILLLTVHHIVCDEVSLKLALGELVHLYLARIRGGHATLPDLLVHFADYAAWERRRLSDGTLADQVAYWTAELGYPPLPVLDLSAGRTRQSELAFRTSRRPLVLSEPRTEALKGLARRAGVTLFTVIAAALCSALRDLYGSDDVRIACQILTRHQPQTMGMIGPLFNTFILRADIGGDDTPSSAVDRVRTKILNAYDNLDVPFEEVVRAVAGGDGARRAALARVMLVFGAANPVHLEAPELTVTELEVGKAMLELDVSGDGETVTTFDLIINLAERPGAIVGSLIYKTELLPDCTVERILRIIERAFERFSC